MAAVNPSSPLPTVRQAVSYSIVALDAAAEVDMDRTPEDRTFFQEQRALLEPHAVVLRDRDYELRDFDLGPGLKAFVLVHLGDVVLDRGLRNGSGLTKAELRGKPGLGATHAFGSRIDDLVRMSMRSEPAAVLNAVDRLNDLPDFPSKRAIATDLTVRAEQQERFLLQREQIERQRERLVTQGVRAVLDAVDALARLRGALDQRFPRQRDYVTSFFLPTRTSPRRTEEPAEPT